MLVKEVPDTYGNRNLDLETGLRGTVARPWPMRSPRGLAAAPSYAGGDWPTHAAPLNRFCPLESAWVVHVPTLFFVVLIVVHVTLVPASGALRELDHLYAAQGSVDPNGYAHSWAGFSIFVVSMIVLYAGNVAARPMVLAPIAGLLGKLRSR